MIGTIRPNTGDTRQDGQKSCLLAATLVASRKGTATSSIAKTHKQTAYNMKKHSFHRVLEASMCDANALCGACQMLFQHIFIEINARATTTNRKYMHNAREECIPVVVHNILVGRNISGQQHHDSSPQPWNASCCSLQLFQLRCSDSDTIHKNRTMDPCEILDVEARHTNTPMHPNIVIPALFITHCHSFCATRTM